MRPTLAFFGSSLVSAYWNGAATYYRGILRALDTRGWRATFFEPDAFGRQAHRDIPDPSWARVLVYQPTPDGLQRALDEAASADVLVKASGVGVFDAELEAALPAMRRPGQICLFWDVDAPATLERLDRTPDDPLRARIPSFDLVLTYGGGPPVVALYRALGARDCVPIYNALDPDTHHPVPPHDAYRADLAFLGNRLPDREERVREFFLSAAAARPARSFLLGGNGWHPDDVPPNVTVLGHVPTAAHNTFNCSPLAVLNINRSSMARIGFSPATRVFEAAGAGACLVTDAFEGVEAFLSPGEEILVADSGADVIGLLDALTPERARAIGRAARARVLAAHTYEHRVVQLERVLDAALTGSPRCSQRSASSFSASPSRPRGETATPRRTAAS
ncbi:MAG TPA: glycosyltransferase [Vicinamibacterales bacterium]